MNRFRIITEYFLAISGLGILVMLLVPNCSNCDHQPARLAKAKTELHNLKSALQMYRLDNRVYPSTQQGLMALVEKPDSEPVPTYWQEGGYIDRLPKDPWQREYYYRNPSANGNVALYTLGRDGIADGEGESSDIVLELEVAEFTEAQNAAWVERKRRREDPDYAAHQRTIETNQ